MICTFQMQPFDLLGITIKSLAEIEKEVSTLDSTLSTPSRPSRERWAREPIYEKNSESLERTRHLL